VAAGELPAAAVDVLHAAADREDPLAAALEPPAAAPHTHADSPTARERRWWQLWRRG
jgi:hypothetical protein